MDLFEAFTRERSSSECGIIGMGLGLRIVKSFVDLMDGSIFVDSEPEKGSCFMIEIPGRIISDEELKMQSKNEPVEISLENRRILLVEDNELNAEIAMTVLQDAHAEVEYAENGEAAVSRLKNVPAGYYDVTKPLQLINCFRRLHRF